MVSLLLEFELDRQAYLIPSLKCSEPNYRVSITYKNNFDKRLIFPVIFPSLSFYFDDRDTLIILMNRSSFSPFGALDANQFFNLVLNFPAKTRPQAKSNH
jgi:hypothetical protein